jgi:hypothetical protein
MEAKQMLLRVVAPLINGGGRVPYGYVFHLFTVRRD